MAKWGLADRFNVLHLLVNMGDLKRTAKKIGIFTVTTKEIDNHVNKTRKGRRLSVLGSSCVIYNLRKMEEDGLLKFKPKELFISHDWSITEKGKKEYKIITLELEILSLRKEKQSVGVTG